MVKETTSPNTSASAGENIPSNDNLNAPAGPAVERYVRRPGVPSPMLGSRPRARKAPARQPLMRPAAKTAKRKLSTLRLADVKSEKVEWFWEPYIPRGTLTILDGDPGVGKSWITYAIAATVSKGAKLPGQTGKTTPKRVLLLSVEDDPAKVIRPRMEPMHPKFANIHIFPDAFTLDTNGVMKLRNTIEDVNPDIVVIDPIVAFTGGKMDVNRSNQVRAMLTPLAGLARDFNCAFLVVRHMRKGAATKAIHRGMGSIDYAATARSGLIAAEDTSERRIFAQYKNSYAQKGASLEFSIIDGSFEWWGPVDVTADELGEDENAVSKLDEAVEFLRDILKKDEVAPQKSIEGSARSAGIAGRTLKRAKKKLRVTSEKMPDGWYWALPKRHDT